MSYDLVMFEKSKIPADPSGFSDWYHQKTKCDDAEDLSSASEKIQEAFHMLRTIFPSVNGPFGISDDALAENPQIEKYICDYNIKEDMMYLCFSYSISGFAHDTVKRAAYFSGVGFYDPNDNSLPVLFESRYPMLLEGQWFRPGKISAFERIKEKLNGMTAKNRSYLSVTDPIGNYIQIGGYKGAFTVEKRIWRTPTAYTHYKAGYAEVKDLAGEGEVWIAGNRIKLKQSQILSQAAAEQLFLDFFQNTKTVPGVEWTEMEI